MKEFRVLSIEAWAGLEQGSWEWNNWYNVDTYLESENGELNEENALRFFFYSLGFKGDFLKFKTLYTIDDDQYNLVLIKNHNSHGEGNYMPLYAIEYGRHY
jgi:hypothetical protein